MAWQNEICVIIRHLISDLDSSDQTYSDSRLEETIVVAAQLLMEQIDFENTYTIDADSLSISPDPTTAGSKDNSFINFVSVKAAIIILRGECKKYANQSFQIKDGPSSISVSDVFKNTKVMLDDMEQALAMAMIQYRIGNARAGVAILTPYTTSLVGSRGSIF